MAMTILITGGAGFVGSYVNKLMTQKGYRCVVLDDLSRGDARSVWKSPLIQGDIANSDLVKKIINDFDVKAVMHFAANINVKESVDDPSKYYFNNVSGTLALIGALREANVNKFVFSSSAAVYGIPREETLNEEHPTYPINPYGQTKLIVEGILKDFDRAYGFKHMILRYFNAAGGDPEHLVKIYNRDHSNLIPKVLCTLLEENPSISVFGLDWPTKDGSGIRDYIHIHDLASAHILALEKLLSGADSSVYNLGNGRGYSVLEVLAAIESVTKRKLHIEKAPRREGDPPILVADSNKALHELGWKPDYISIDKMVEDAWIAISALNFCSCA